MRVHVIQSGRLEVRAEVLERYERGDTLPRALLASLGRSEKTTFPVFSFLVEHSQGHLVIDTGLDHSFPKSKKLAPDITLVPIPGHSVGQVAIVIRTDGPTLFFAGDHCFTQDHFVRDFAADRLNMLGVGKAARTTSRRIAAFTREVPTMLIPSHDWTAAERLAEREPILV